MKIQVLLLSVISAASMTSVLFGNEGDVRPPQIAQYASQFAGLSRIKLVFNSTVTTGPAWPKEYDPVTEHTSVEYTVDGDRWRYAVDVNGKALSEEISDGVKMSIYNSMTGEATVNADVTLFVMPIYWNAFLEPWAFLLPEHDKDNIAQRMPEWRQLVDQANWTALIPRLDTALEKASETMWIIQAGTNPTNGKEYHYKIEFVDTSLTKIRRVQKLTSQGVLVNDVELTDLKSYSIGKSTLMLPTKIISRRFNDDDGREFCRIETLLRSFAEPSQSDLDALEFDVAVADRVIDEETGVTLDIPK